MTQDNKIELLLHILTHLDQYIKYYNPATFDDDLKELGYVVECGGYTYKSVEDFVLTKQPIIENRYVRENFLNWYKNGVSWKDPKLDTPAKYEMVVRDINVIKQEILILYFFKNWEKDKNIYVIGSDSNFIQIKDEILYHGVNYLAAARNTSLYGTPDFDNYTHLAKFKEDGDCQVIACGVANTPDQFLDAKIHTLVIITTREPMKLVDRPFMFLHYTFDYDVSNTIKGLIVSAIEEDRTNDESETNYDEFYEEYEDILRTTLSAAVYTSAEIKGTGEYIVQVNKSYKKANPANIKNRYREIEINYIK